MGSIRLLWTAWRDKRASQPAPATTGLGDAELDLVNRHQACLREIDAPAVRASEPLRAHLEAVRRRLEEEQWPAFERCSALAGGRRHEHIMFSPVTHWVLLLGIALGEIVFNAQAFNVFGEAQWQTLVFALGVGVAVPTAAYFFGQQLRQATWTPRRSLVWAGLLCAVGAVLVAVNAVRGDWVALLATQEGRSLQPGGLALSFLAMNVLVFLGATVVSYGGHDPVEGFVASRAAVLACETTAASLAGSLAAATELRRVAHRLVSEACDQSLLRYRAVNRRGRPDVPRHFDDPSLASHRPVLQAAAATGVPMPASFPDLVTRSV